MEKTLRIFNRPRSIQMQSVNVPPVSTAMRNGEAFFFEIEGSLVSGIAKNGFYRKRGRTRSAATNKNKTTEMTPFIVKKAALSLDKSLAETSECS